MFYNIPLFSDKSAFFDKCMASRLLIPLIKNIQACEYLKKQYC